MNAFKRAFADVPVQAGHFPANNSNPARPAVADARPGEAACTAGSTESAGTETTEVDGAAVPAETAVVDATPAVPSPHAGVEAPAQNMNLALIQARFNPEGMLRSSKRHSTFSTH